MIECPTHGTRQSVPCCGHVWDASADGLACELAAVVFDAYDVGFLVCSACLETARQYVRARTDEELEACAFNYSAQCRICLDTWIEKMNYVPRAVLAEEARKRA